MPTDDFIAVSSRMVSIGLAEILKRYVSCLIFQMQLVEDKYQQFSAAFRVLWRSPSEEAYFRDLVISLSALLARASEYV